MSGQRLKSTGRLIAIEGLDAVGKKTQSQRLSDWLRQTGIKTSLMSFPDYYTPIGKEIKAFLARGAAKRLLLAQRPAYAPELNPDEGVGNLLKRVELKNVCCRDLGHLATELRKAKDRLRHKPELIRSCVRQCGCQV